MAISYDIDLVKVKNWTPVTLLLLDGSRHRIHPILNEICTALPDIAARMITECDAQKFYNVSIRLNNQMLKIRLDEDVRKERELLNG